MTVPIPETSDKHAVYIVTAAHVIRAITERSPAVLVRVNTRSGGVAVIRTNVPDWLLNEDQRIDVAVCPIGGFERIDHLAIPSRILLGREAILADNIGPGDELFFPGLFVRHYGTERNIPIVRTGAIAAMPRERIETVKCGNMHAYLAEARSIGGFSGSPVFCYTGPVRLRGDQHQFTPPKYYLLGLVHGHFGVKDEYWDSLLEEASADADQKRSINMGIAIIVPSDDILSTLNDPKLVAERDALRVAILNRRQEEPPEAD